MQKSYDWPRSVYPSPTQRYADTTVKSENTHVSQSTLYTPSHFGLAGKPAKPIIKSTHTDEEACSAPITVVTQPNMGEDILLLIHGEMAYRLGAYKTKSLHI